MYFILQDSDIESQSAMEQTVMGVYIILKEGALPDDDPQDIGVLIEGVEVLSDLSSIAQARALLFGLIYCLNLSYPPELKLTFKVLQKIFLNLNGQVVIQGTIPQKQSFGVSELKKTEKSNKMGSSLCIWTTYFWHSSSKQATGASEFEQDWCTSDYLFYYYYYYFTAQKIVNCLFYVHSCLFKCKKNNCQAKVYLTNSQKE